LRPVPVMGLDDQTGPVTQLEVAATGFTQAHSLPT